MIEIPLTHGKVAIIDNQDYELVSRHKWHYFKGATGVEYARCRRPPLYMHCLILNPSPDKMVDHINGDGLDNRRENLRPATLTQNSRNQRRRVNNTSGYKGVSQEGGKWRARISINGKDTRLGIFTTKEEAARAYDDAARKNFGEFARLNFSVE